MKPKMIVIPVEGWFTTFQRPHHFARYFKEEYEIIVIQKKYIGGKAYGYASAQALLVDRIVNIYLLRGGGRLAWIRSFNEMIYRLQLRRSLNKLVVENSVIYTWNVADKTCLSFKNNTHLIYDAMDDWSAFDGRESVIAKCELELARQSDVVLAVSDKLFRRFSKINSNTILVRNGADTSYFRGARTHLKSPKDALYRYNQKTIIGYVGHLGGWVDSSLIAECAAKLPEFIFVVIGPGSSDTVQLLRTQQNIIYVGAVPYDQLIPYLAYFSVGLIPFVLNKLNESTNPIKLYEYLATGIPVVSTAMPEVLQYEEEGVVYVSDRNMFSQAITRAAHHADKPDLRARRFEVALNNSWKSRAKEISKSLFSLNT